MPKRDFVQMKELKRIQAVLRQFDTHDFNSTCK